MFAYAYGSIRTAKRSYEFAAYERDDDDDDDDVNADDGDDDDGDDDGDDGGDDDNDHDGDDDGEIPHVYPYMCTGSQRCYGNTCVRLHTCLPTSA